MATGVASVWLPVDDMDRAVGFYRDVLGLPIEQQSAQWSSIDANGVMIGLNQREGTGDGDGGAVVAFQPDGDLEGEVQRLRDEGVDFTGDISEHPWGRIVPFQDSEGNDLQLYAPPN